MKPDFPKDERSALESSLTALLLGELPHDQAAALHHQLAQDPELAKLCERLKQTISLVRETLAHPVPQTAEPLIPLRLEGQRRQKLLQHFKTIAPKEFAPPRFRLTRWFVPIGIAAAVVALLAATLLPRFTSRFQLASWVGTEVERPVARLSADTALDRAEAASPLQIQRNLQLTHLGVENPKSATPAAALPEPAASPAKPTSPAIVLPQSSEVADATLTTTVEAVRPWSETANLRGFYDDSLGGSGGQAGGGGFGGRSGGSVGSGGGATGDASPAGGRQTEVTAANSVIGNPEWVGALHAGKSLGDVQQGLASSKPSPSPLSGDAQKLGEAKDPAITLEGLTTIPSYKQALKMADLAHATPLAGPAPEPQGQLELGWAGESQPVPSSQYYGGGAYQDRAQSRPALRSPKDAGLGGGVGGAATAPAPAGPQEVAANMESFRRRYALAGPGSPLKPAEAITPLPGAVAPRQYDQKALGFDWYLGDTLQRGGQIPARDGMAASEADQALVAGLKTAPPPPSEPTTAEPLVPLQGMRYLPNDAEKVKSVEWADESLGLAQRPVEGEARGEEARGKNVHSLDVVGYANKPITATNDFHALFVDSSIDSSTVERYTNFGRLSQLGTDLNGAVGIAKTPIVLPSAQPEISLALNYSSAVEQNNRQLSASAGRGTEGVNKLQIADLRDADNTPKMRIGTQPSDRWERRLVEAQAHSEPTEGNKERPSAPAPIPQPEVQTTENVFSTFSLNVSDVSFKLAAASLEKGVLPEPATVRSEEFINAFDYRDPEPPPGVPVAFAWERAQYPFAQNRDLLRFSLKTAALGRQPGRPLNLVLLLDNSGSMERADRVQIIREALRVLAGQLQPQDKFSVVTFARTARLWVDGVPGNQAAQAAEEAGNLTPQGGTNLEDAMNLAYQTALRHYLANGVNRVVLLTDGAANLGDVNPETLKQKVEAHRKQGIALDCFGIGWEGYNDDLLEVLSRNGDGRYGFVNTPEEAATEFAGQLAGALHVAASDVKVQVEFNPARVTAYRQIGYARHQLTKEQFRDNTVNAAQIGAAESGNALYVIAVNPGGDGPLATVRVRYRVPGTTEYHEHEWPVPYTGNAVALEQASPAMRLAAAASAFSEWLVSSPYAGDVTPDRLLGYLSGVPEVYGADARPKRLEWMIRQAKSIAGK